MQKPGRTLLSLVLLLTSVVSVYPQGRAEVTTISFESKLVQKTLPYIVVLPPGYASDANKERKYPVLYLLHGLFGHYTDWTSRTRLTTYASQYQILIVTPEGNDGWYVDSARKQSNKYETYIVRELIPDVERRFRVNRNRSHRAVAGLSMGGYGALKFGVKYPQLFAFAASMSGALEPATWEESDLKNMQNVFRTLSPVFGDSTSITRRANDLPKLYEDVRPAEVSLLPYIYLDCGSDDPFLQSNQEFSRLLLRRKVPHEFRVLPGNHGWSYWDQQINEVLRVAAKIFPGQ